MLRTAWYLGTLLSVIAFLLGCREPANPAPSSQSSGFDSARTITFRQGCPLGYRYTAIGRREQMYKNPNGVPMVSTLKIDSELVKIEADLYTWKRTTTEVVEQMGSHHWLPGEGPDKNRIRFYTNNSFGNLVSSEGTDPDNSYTSYKSRPERPVKVGDTWDGYTLKRGGRFNDSYTLEAIANINGKEYAVVRCDSEEKGGSSSSRSWIELSTGVLFKIERNVSDVNEAGEMGKWRLSVNVVDAKSRPILP